MGKLPIYPCGMELLGEAVIYSYSRMIAFWETRRFITVVTRVLNPYLKFDRHQLAVM